MPRRYPTRAFGALARAVRAFGGSRTIVMPEAEVPPFRAGPPLRHGDPGYAEQVRQTITTRRAVAAGLGIAEPAPAGTGTGESA